MIMAKLLTANRQQWEDDNNGDLLIDFVEDP